MEDELKELKAELKDIKSITPNDNLRFLQNQILKRVELGLLSSENTIIKLRVELRELNKQIKNK